MASVPYLLPARWTSRLSGMLAQVGQWWVAEFLRFFPERVAERLMDRGYKMLTVIAEPDAFVLQLSSDRHRPLASSRIPRGDWSAASIDIFLKAQQRGRDETVIGVRLPRDQVFSRRLVLPLEAARSIGEIAERDLAAKTPFKLTDIYHDHQSRTESERVIVWQWIVRREFVADAAEKAGLDLADVTFVEADSDGAAGLPAPRLALRHDRNRRLSWPRRTFYALALSASCLASVACAHRYLRQQQVVDDLTAELATARAKAQQVRAALDRLDQKQAAIAGVRAEKRDAPGVLEVWEETSRLLPLTSWLTELRISEVAQKQDRRVVMTGLSAAAADLVPLVDRSPVFADAALTAPIALDPVEQRERFTLQAKIRQASHAEPATRKSAP